MNYLDLLKQSWNDFWANLILLVPMILQAIVSGVVAVGLFTLGLYVLFTRNGIDFAIENLTPSLFTSDMILSGVGFFVLFLLLMLVITAWFNSGYLAMIVEIVKKGKTSWRGFIQGTQVHFKHYLSFLFIIGIVWIALAAPLTIGLLLIFSKMLLPGAILSIVGFLLLLILGIIISFGVFFAQPILFFNTLNASDTFRQCVDFSKRHFTHALLTFLISIGVGIAVGMVLAIVIVPFQMLAENNVVFSAVYTGLNVIKSVLQVVLSIILSIFLFHAYAKTKEFEKPSKKSKSSN